MARVDARHEPTVSEMDEVNWDRGFAKAYRSLDLPAVVDPPFVWAPFVTFSAWLGQVTLFPTVPVVPSLVQSVWILMASCIPAVLMLLVYRLRWGSAIGADLTSAAIGVLTVTGLLVWSPYHPDDSASSIAMVVVAVAGGLLLRHLRRRRIYGAA